MKPVTPNQAAEPAWGSGDRDRQISILAAAVLLAALFLPWYHVPRDSHLGPSVVDAFHGFQHLGFVLEACAVLALGSTLFAGATVQRRCQALAGTVAVVALAAKLGHQQLVAPADHAFTTPGEYIRSDRTELGAYIGAIAATVLFASGWLGTLKSLRARRSAQLAAS